MRFARVGHVFPRLAGFFWPRMNVPAWVVSAPFALGLFVVANPCFGLEPLPSPGSSKIAGGVALMVSGVMFSGLGAGIYVANENANHASCVPCAEKGWIFPTVLMGLGGAMFVAGVPLVVLGTIERGRSLPPATATLFVGPTSVSARLSF